MGVFQSLVKSRHSCRKYANRPLEREKVEACLEIARLAPSACNSQPWYFAVATGDAARGVGATTQQYGVNAFADQPPVFVTVWEDRAKLLPQLTSDFDSQHYAAGDVGICVAYLALAATDMGLGTCVMGIFDEEKIRALLGVPAEKKLRYVVAMGYPDESNRVPDKARKPLSEICSFSE